MMEWIKVKTRKVMPEERELYPASNFIWDMKTPEGCEAVLLTDGNIVWIEEWEVYDYGLSKFEYTDPDDYENLWYTPFPEAPKIEEV